MVKAEWAIFLGVAYLVPHVRIAILDNIHAK
jgi:hypothetical protein